MGEIKLSGPQAQGTLNKLDNSLENFLFQGRLGHLRAIPGARAAVPFEGGDESQGDQPEIKIIDHNWRAAPLSPDKTIRSGPINADDEEENSVVMDYDVIVRQCLDAARRTIIRNIHQPRLDPLRSLYYLPDLFEAQAFSQKTEDWPDQPPFGYGCAPVGIVDDVVAQSQYPLMLDLARQGSYCSSGLGVSSKTTMLQGLIFSAAEQLTLRPHPQEPAQTKA